VFEVLVEGRSHGHMLSGGKTSGRLASLLSLWKTGFFTSRIAVWKLGFLKEAAG